MEALIPKLFILTAEASIVLFLILVLVIIFNNKAKRKDIKAASQLISQYVNNEEARIAAIKSHLQHIAFSDTYDGKIDEQAEKLYKREKSLLKEFITLYLRRDTRQLINYPETIMAADDYFLTTSAAACSFRDKAMTNATILAQEQAESRETHLSELSELSELRQKNTELNEHLFEALETINTLMAEHGNKTDQEVESNAQKILEAIIYLRNNRLGRESAPEQLAPSLNDQLEAPWIEALADQEKSEKT